MNQTQTSRLAALARLWGKVQWMHPSLADAAMDLTQPTVRAIAAVLAARSKDDYRQALEAFLDSVGDPLTRLQAVAPKSSSGRTWPELDAVWHWTKDGVGVLRLSAFDRLGDDGFFALQKAISQVKTSKALIFDFRGATSSAWYFSGFVSGLLREPLKLPSKAFRRHSGFSTELGSTSGGYWSSFETTEGRTLFPNRQARKRGISCPIVLLLDGDPDLVALGSALFSAGIGGAVLEGDFQPVKVVLVQLTGGLVAQVRTEEWINPDGTKGLGWLPRVEADNSSDSYLSSSAVRMAIKLASKPPRPKSEARSTQRKKLPAPFGVEFPDMPTRIYAWFKFWNVIHYFYPYHDHTDRPWDEALVHFLPRFAGASTPDAYALVAAEAATWMNDTHAGVGGAAATGMFGAWSPSILLRSVRNKFVVTDIDETLSHHDIQVGDEVSEVDGVSVENLRAKFSKMIASSTPQAFEDAVGWRMLYGESVPVRLGIKRPRKNFIVELPRDTKWFVPTNDDPTFKILPEGYGYIDMTRLVAGDALKALEAVKQTPALIMDIRGYPQGTMFILAPRFTKKRVIGARFQRPELVPRGDSPSAIDTDRRPIFQFDQLISPDAGWKYDKPIVALIDARAVSQAEHSCLFLEATSDVTFIGTHTSGTNGDVTAMRLPGGLSIRFSGHDVRHADGRQLQRVGIIPDIEVEPTLAGIRAGRDEVLEAAVDHLKSLTGL